MSITIVILIEVTEMKRGYRTNFVQNMICFVDAIRLDIEKTYLKFIQN